MPPRSRFWQSSIRSTPTTPSTGVLMFRPLPKHLKADQNEICNRLDPKKDVDCMTHLSQRRCV